MSQTHQPRTTTHDEAMIHKVTNAELKMKNLGTLEVVSGETMNLAIYGEHGDIDEEGDNMEWNKNTRLMCQCLVLNPLKCTNEVTSIYTSSEIGYL